MSLIARAFLLRQQLKESRNRKICPRCGPTHDKNADSCPHCAGLSDLQVEHLREQQKKAQTGNALYLVLVLAGLMLLFGLLALVL
ncbi:MAG: hypothetical protein ACOCPQ_05150 [Desulfosudaceae bacterium]